MKYKCSLKNLFIPCLKGVNYIYSIPRFSDGGLNIPLQIKKIFNVEVEMGIS